MRFGLRGGVGALLAMSLFAAPAMGQQASDDEEEDTGSVLEDGATDVAQHLAEKALDRKPSQPTVSSTSNAASVADDSVQGLEALTPVEDDAAKLMAHPGTPPRGSVRLPPNPALRGAARPAAVGNGLQVAEGAAAMGDDALHAFPASTSTFGDDVARGVHVGAYADDTARVGVGLASHADDAARLAGGGLVKIGADLAALGALVAKLLGGGKKDE